MTIDCRRDLQKEELYLADLFKKKDIPLNLLLTKADKLNQKQRSSAEKRFKDYAELFHLHEFISSTTGRGFDGLFNYLKTLG